MRISRPLLLFAATVALVLPATPSYATTEAAPASQSTRIVELKAPQPDWYTPALHAKTLAAAEQGLGVAIPDGADVETSALLFTGIRPGSWMISPSGCTLNFVFGSSSDYYVGTAGHCAKVGEEVTIIAAPGLLMNIGTTVKSVDNGIGDDFALIDVRPEMEQFVNPSTAYFGGPTSAGDPQVGDLVVHVGHGLVIGTGGTPRAGAVAYRGVGDKARSDAIAWAGAASPGDSGSPVQLVSGEAAGDLTHLVVDTKYLPGEVAGTTIARMLEIAGKPLATAPSGPDPT